MTPMIKHALPLLATALFTVKAYAQFSTTIMAYDAFCGLDNGHALANHSQTSGSTYTYLWSNGGTERFIEGLAPGEYSVTVTDQNGVSEETSVTIGMSPSLPVYGTWMPACAMDACEGRVFVTTATDQTAQPMTYSVDPPQCSFAEADLSMWSLYQGAFILHLQQGTTYTITATDVNGCSGTITNTIETLGPSASPWGGWPIWTNSADQIVPACGTASDGSFRVVAQDDWMNWMLIGPNGTEFVQFTQPPYVFSDLAPGTYHVYRNTWGDNGFYLGYCEQIEVVIPSLSEPCSTGIEGSTQEEGQIGLRPNPVYETLYVAPLMNSTGALQVFAIDGRMVNAPTARRMNSIEVDVRALAPGTYMVRTAEGSARFVKQ